jgi:uncharacterized membrane protein YdcZ (DUF606 family)
MCIILSLILGGLLGSFAIQISNKIFDTSDKPLLGALAGTLVGFIIVFVYGVIDVPNPETFNKSFYIAPMIYTGVVGCYIGTIVFTIFNAARVIREIIKSYIEERNYKRRKSEHQSELSFYQSKNSLDGKK